MTAKREISNADDIVRAYCSGVSKLQLLKENGISDALFKRLLRERGVKQRSRSEHHALRWGKELKDLSGSVEEICQSYNGGKSTVELSSFYGVSINMINLILKNNGVRIRTKSEIAYSRWDKFKSESPEIAKRILDAVHEGRRKTFLYDSLDSEIIKLDDLSNSEIQTAIGVGKTFLARRRSKLGIVAEPRRRTAIARQKSAENGQPHPTMLGIIERALIKRFFDDGIIGCQQMAIDNFNVDFAITSHRIAVEIESRDWKRRSKSINRERIEKIIRSGWHVFVIKTGSDISAIDADTITQQLIAFKELICRNKPTECQYGMIGRDGQPISSLGSDLEYFARVEGF